MLSKHQIKLVQDLRLQPNILTTIYIILGLIASIVAIFVFKTEWVASILLFFGGALVALGFEKKVSREIRKIALHMINQHHK